MKKFFIATLILMLPACACFDCSDDYEETPVTYQTTRNYNQDCDYFDGHTCYRYVYRKHNHRTVRPDTIRHRPCNSCNARRERPACDNCNRCNTCARRHSNRPDTREPVEIIYKRTSYQTVCDPKTVEKVTYEKEPYYN